jgi:YYY domain-containing protein
LSNNRLAPFPGAGRDKRAVKITIRWQTLALFAIVLLGLALRLYGLNWDQGNSFHPDERQIMFHVTALAWPGSVAQFFDVKNSPLNPQFFAYGSFPMYLLAIIGNILTRFYPALGSFANLTLVGRVLSALFDSGTILLTGWLALLLADNENATADRHSAWNVAILAAALVAFTPFQLQLAHFYAVDSVLLFFVELTVLACVALVTTDAPIRWALVAGLGYGLALATKFSAAPLIMPLLVAVLLRWQRHDLYSAILSFLYVLTSTTIVFLIAMPYALLDLNDFVQQVAQQGDLARGALDLPYVRQFAGTTPYMYEVQNMVLWGMGVTLGVAAFAGLLWLCWRVWKRNAGSWLVVLAWVIPYSAITGSFYVKYMRYMLPVYPFLTLMALALLFALVKYCGEKDWGSIIGKAGRALPYAAIVLVLAGTIFQGLALLNIYSQPNTRISASRWIYSHLKPGSVLTYEQWDDPLPVSVDGHEPDEFQQLVYLDANQQSQTGLDLYGDDTVEKAQLLAKLLPKVDAITMATDRLDKSIPRLPFRYPLTIHYYQLLFSGQLGFHLAAQFENHPNLFGIVLNDSNADESYSVFDHPTTRIFVRDNPYPYTSDQLFHKLLQGVQLPPLGAQLSGAQRSLLLSTQQIADDQQSPPFGVQFPADSFANTVPVLTWWLVITLLGLATYPLVFAAFGTLADRGYIFSKTLGILLLAYIAWMLASLHLLAFSHLSVALIFVALVLCAAQVFIWRWRIFGAFARQHWRLLLFEEGLFSAAFLLFVYIRSLNPDLWNIFLGGEKPMELAFLNAILRSPYMPPYDPWFAGGYINYYYYGYVIIGSLIKLTSIIPTTAFNLAIPTLFALTFTGAVSIVYSLTRRLMVALLGGYFVALIGNLNGAIQLRAQVEALLSHKAPVLFDYWQSSRIIPNTINEFPFWSFLFADLHPHVIDMPIAVLMLGIIAAIFLARSERKGPPAPRVPARSTPTIHEMHGEQFTRGMVGARLRHSVASLVLAGTLGAGRTSLYFLAAFVFGTIACVNTWDMPVYALLLGVALLLRTMQEKRESPKHELFVALGFCLTMMVLLYGLGYLFYWPFYAWYQQLYVNGLGLVPVGSNLGDFLTVFGLWIFLALSFLLLELYRCWTAYRVTRVGADEGVMRAIHISSARRVTGFLLLSAVVLAFATLLGLKTLLFVLVVTGILLFVLRSSKMSAAARYTYILLLMGLCICLGQEIVYVRDFLDGGDYERMNTVFKFSIQAWLCFGVGGALAAYRLWRLLRGPVKRAWYGMLVVLVAGCSLFLTGGTASRINDHQVWINARPPAQSADYTPTLDGFAFARAWYLGDAQAISWLNANVAGSPVVLEAEATVSYQWFGRVSVYTGLPDVLGWPDHVSEQRYDYQPLNRLTDIGIIYTTTNTAQAIELLQFYRVHYIYVGALERQTYGAQSSAGLDKFERMVDNSLRKVYQADGVTIYEVL